jgi:uncharacterized membrane protein YkvI
MIDAIISFVSREIEGAKALLSPECRPLLILTIVAWYFAWTKFGLRELVYIVYALIKKIIYLCIDLFRYFKNKRGGYEN